MVQETKIQELVKMEQRWDQEMEKVYAIISGQRTPAMKAKLRSHKKFKDINDENNTLQLIELIKENAYNVQENK